PHQVLTPATVAVAGTAVSTGFPVGLRALAAARYSLRSRLAQSATSLVGAIVGAATGGAVRAAWGTAVGIWIGVLVWWTYWRRGLREREFSETARTADSATEPIDVDGPRTPA